MGNRPCQIRFQNEEIKFDHTKSGVLMETEIFFIFVPFFIPKKKIVGPRPPTMIRNPGFALLQYPFT